MAGIEDKQISISIADFVMQEAREKAFEIEVKALKQFEKEKQAIVDAESFKIENEILARLNQKEMDFKIKRSTSINKSRLEKMETRNKAMMKIFSEAQYQLFKRIESDKSFYQDLLVKLIQQGLIKLFENKVLIKCLEKDIAIVEKAIPLASKQFTDLVKQELGKDFKVEIKINKDHFLTERTLKNNQAIDVVDYTIDIGNSEVIGKNEDDQKCFGGVILTNVEGNIICKNTLDVRVDLCFQDSLPNLRAILFPEGR